MMYQARRTEEHEELYSQNCKSFPLLQSYIDERRSKPKDGFNNSFDFRGRKRRKVNNRRTDYHLYPLLNAGHEATVHSLGNGIKFTKRNKITIDWQSETKISFQLSRRFLRFDLLLYFTRYVRPN